MREWINLIEAQFRQPRIMYHGTTSSFLHSILKQGVIPDPPKRLWAQDVQQVQTSFSRASLAGSYWTSNMMTASGAAVSTMNKFGGDEIIVIAQIAEQSAYADEDNINHPLMWAMSDTVHDLYPQVRADFWIAIAEDLFGAKRAAVQAIFAQHLHTHLKGAMQHVIDHKLSDDVLDTLMLRAMVYEQKNGMHLDTWMRQVPEHLPSIDEIEQRLLALRERITRTYRSTAFYNADKFNHTLRMPNVVGFKGSNRIRWILLFKKWQWEKTDGGGDESKKLVIKPITLVYGEPILPNDFVDQYQQRIGKFPGLIDSSGKELIPSQRDDSSK